MHTYVHTLKVYLAALRKHGMRRGIPNRLMNVDNRARRIDSSLMPTVEEAVNQYQLTGGRISEPCSFGTDPLEFNNILKEIRYKAFISKFSFQNLFCHVSNGCGESLVMHYSFLLMLLSDSLIVSEHVV